MGGEGVCGCGETIQVEDSRTVTKGLRSLESANFGCTKVSWKLVSTTKTSVLPQVFIRARKNLERSSGRWAASSFSNADTIWQIGGRRITWRVVPLPLDKIGCPAHLPSAGCRRSGNPPVSTPVMTRFSCTWIGYRDIVAVNAPEGNSSCGRSRCWQFSGCHRSYGDYHVVWTQFALTSKQAPCIRAGTIPSVW